MIKKIGQSLKREIETIFDFAKLVEIEMKIFWKHEGAESQCRNPWLFGIVLRTSFPPQDAR